MNVLIIDCEGFGGIDEEMSHDTRIFLFSVFLSSFFIYNQVGSLNENALENISLIINLIKSIKIKNIGLETEEDIKNIFPFLFWVIRDFILEIKDANG